MPKDQGRTRRAGVSRQVRTTTFVHPSQIRNASNPHPDVPTRKIAKVLGFKARAEETALANKRLKESMQGTKC